MSMRNRALAGLTVVGLLLAAGGVQAANLSFLNDTPISNMKQRDTDSIKHAVDSALDEKKDGETVHWVNEGTGNSVRIEAAITLNNTTQEGGRTCRSTAVILQARGQSMNLRPVFCREGTEAWKLQRR